MTRHVEIGDRRVGPDEPAYVVAEAGANHDGDLEQGKRLVDAAADAGVDAVKFQNYTAERLVTRTAPKYWGDRDTTQYETFAELDVLKREDYHELAAHAEERGVTYLSTPFDRDAVDLLCEIGVPAYKIASGDLTHHPLLRYVAERGKPVVLSTGMATLEEIREAVGVIEATGNERVILLHCITKYPTPVEEINLRMMGTLMEAFDYPVGLSDHTMGTTVPTAAAAMGAAFVEKHFTIDRGLEKSPDHRLSATPEEMAEIVERTRDVRAAMGRAEQGPTDLEREGLEKARRSLVADRALEQGERLSREAIAVKRPGTGIPPKHWWDVDDWRAARGVPADTVLSWADVETGDGEDTEDREDTEDEIGEGGERSDTAGPAGD
jgi:N-acetylneuraminate synthase/N,N'-diacetyllegionaminate synthase